MKAEETCVRVNKTYMNIKLSCMKKIMTTVVLLVVCLSTAMAQDFERGIFNHAALNVGVGTEGINIGAASTLTNYLEIEAGVNIMPGFKSLLKGDVSIDQQTIPVNYGSGTFNVNYPASTVNVKGNLSRTSLFLKAHCYPFGGDSKFFVAAGLYFGGKKIAKVSGHSDQLQQFIDNPKNYVDPQYWDYIPADYKQQVLGEVGAQLADYNVKFDENYDLTGDLRVNAVRPYLGLGFGRLVTKNRIGFRMELGCQFMGKLKVYQGGSEVDIKQALDDADADDDISKVIDKITVYPVLKFSLVGRIL